MFSLALALALSGTQALKADRPPNVVVILADDIGAKELACYGNTLHQTPNLDRLAREGMRFETCYAEPICSPTRVTIMTGQYGFRTGYFNLIGRPFTPLPSSPDYDIGTKFTFADLVKTREYATALSGKWQLTGKIPDLIHECGFDTYRMWAYTNNLPPGVKHTGEFEGGDKTSRYWHPSIVQDGQYLPTKPDDYGPDLFTDFLIEFARTNRDRPFLAYFPMPLTHGPHVETPDPANPGKRLPGGFKTNVEYLDHLMGRLVDAIDAMGLAEQTVILFVGDNGTGGSGKGQVTELGARVPLIVRCPGLVKANVVSRELTDISDVFPTIAELTGATIPPDLTIDGKSLLPTLKGESATHRDWIFSFIGDGRILRDKRWLLELKGNGNENFYDCGESRDGTAYRDVTRSTDPAVRAARLKFSALLEQLPGPKNHPGLKTEPAAAPEDELARTKSARKAVRKKAAAPAVPK